MPRLTMNVNYRLSPHYMLTEILWVEPPHDKTNKMTVRPARTDQPGHPPSLISVLPVRSMVS